ncbi:MAG: hypothetical protein AUJ90_01830 [Gallionellaceae bacterium CG1_02_60_948]|nr:MAG: hypothetical protein AUJ90_01830 [Gallionellaceae bacterium CG1_02_60_948]
MERKRTASRPVSTRDLLGAERQNQRLARTRHAAHDAVTLAHAARHLFLLHVHHFQYAVFSGRGIFRRPVKRQRNLGDANLRE